MKLTVLIGITRLVAAIGYLKALPRFSYLNRSSMIELVAPPMRYGPHESYYPPYKCPPH